jgi:hypothetical protein
MPSIIRSLVEHALVRATSPVMATLGVFVAAAAFAQSPPDLRGIWVTLSGANRDLEKDKVIIDPRGGKIPYNLAAAALRQKLLANRAKEDPENKCFQPGVPRATYTSRFQIFQNASAVYIVYESVHAFRIIYLDNPKHNDGLPYAMGDSRGHWEGNALVADVTSFSDQTWFDRTGTHHTDALHVVERYTRPDRQTLMYEARIEDPGVFTRPWTIRVPLKLDSTALLEDECEAGANGTLGHVSPFKAAK